MRNAANVHASPEHRGLRSDLSQLTGAPDRYISLALERHISFLQVQQYSIYLRRLCGTYV
jgi:hypothetical protein